MQRSDQSHFPPPPAYPEGAGNRQGVNIDVPIGKNVAGGPKQTVGASSKSSGYVQNKSITSSGITIQVNKEGAGQHSPSNYVNVGKMDNQRAALLASAGYRPQQAGAAANYANLPNMSQENNASTYSSPRSSISYDSKGSSPRGSLANHPPPPPYDYQRHAAASPLSLVSPRSSISTDSKHSGSPRASMTGLQNLMDKFPTRSNLHSQSLYINTHDGGHHHHQPQSPRSITSSLMERFNEPAPPPPQHYERRSSGGGITHQIPVQHIHHGGNQAHGTGHSTGRPARPNLPIPEPHPSSGAHHHPIRVVNTASRASTQNAITPTIRLRGLNYDTVPPKAKEGQSEAEKKLAALTEQLEKDMHIENNSGVRRGSDASEPPPPPYPGSRPTVIPVKSIGQQQQQMTSPLPPSMISPASSSTSSRSAPPIISPYKTPLPVQITPPKPKGPSEAEKKLEALTQELETQMEQNPQGDYYGEFFLAIPL